MTLIFLEVWSTCPSFGLWFFSRSFPFEVLICYHFDDLVGEEQGTSASIQLAVGALSPSYNASYHAPALYRAGSQLIPGLNMFMFSLIFLIRLIFLFGF